MKSKHLYVTSNFHEQLPIKTLFEETQEKLFAEHKLENGQKSSKTVLRGNFSSHVFYGKLK